MRQATKVFISYSRRNQQFVQHMAEALHGRGFDVWVDVEDIPKSAEWWREICKGIEAADVFIFIITPDSLQSEVCNWEADYAILLNKRIIPILHQDVFANGITEAIKPLGWQTPQGRAVFAQRNWQVIQSKNFINIPVPTPAGLNEVLYAISLDLNHLTLHTRLTQRAVEWTSTGRRGSFLLRGAALREARKWLKNSRGKEPPPSSIHLEYIQKSQQAARVRRRTTAIGVIVLLIALVSGLYIIQSLFETNQQTTEERDEAQLVALSRDLAIEASDRVDTDPDLSLLLAVAAFRMSETTEARAALRNSIEVNQYLAGYFLTTDDAFPDGYSLEFGSVAFSPDSSRLAVGRCLQWEVDAESRLGCQKSQVEVLAIDSFKTIATLDYFAGQTLYMPDNNTLWMADDGHAFFVSDENAEGKILEWDLGRNSVEPINLSVANQYPSSELSLAGLLPEQNIVVYADYGDLIIWNIETDQEIQFIPETSFFGVGWVSFSPSNDLLGLPNSFNTEVYNWRTGQKIASLGENTEDGHLWRVTSIGFSEDGRHAVTGDERGGLIFWNIATGEPLRNAESTVDRRGNVQNPPDIAHNSWVNSSNYVMNDRMVLSAAFDNGQDEGIIARPPNQLILWQADNHWALGMLNGHPAPLDRAVIAPDGYHAASYDESTNVLLWDFSISLDDVRQMDETALVAHACKVANRTLTRSEWAQFLPEQEYRDVCRSP
jgi:WD40 repeat protein